MGAGFDQMPEMPPMEGNDGMSQEGNIPMGPEDNMPDAPMDNTAQGGDPSMGDAQVNQFDTNFDAGVEADEDEDPKKYIQQLTGKLSQKLNSYNGENNDEELSKYVGKMIIKQVAKGLDDEAKKDLIKTLKTTEGNDVDGDGEGLDMENNEDMPMNECSFTKNELRRLFENLNMTDTEDEEKLVKPNTKVGRSKTFGGKKF